MLVLEKNYGVKRSIKLKDILSEEQLKAFADAGISVQGINEAINKQYNIDLNSKQSELEKETSVKFDTLVEGLSQKFDEQRISPVPGYVYRMDYARVMFALKWNCKDLIGEPQVEVHRRVVDPLPKRKIKWLDKNMQPQEEIL